EFTTHDAGFVDRLQARVHGFDKGRFLKRHFVRNLHDATLRNPRHDTHVLGEAAPVRIESRGEPNLFILRTLRIELPITIEAAPARYVMKTADAISHLPAADAPHGCNRSSDFMTEDLRWRNKRVLHFFHIRSANATSRHPDEHFAFENFRYRNIFRYHPCRTAINAGAHGLIKRTVDRGVAVKFGVIHRT